MVPGSLRIFVDICFRSKRSQKKTTQVSHYSPGFEETNRSRKGTSYWKKCFANGYVSSQQGVYHRLKLWCLALVELAFLFISKFYTKWITWLVRNFHLVILHLFLEMDVGNPKTACLKTTVHFFFSQGYISGCTVLRGTRYQALSLNHTSPTWKNFAKDTENPVVKPIYLMTHRIHGTTVYSPHMKTHKNEPRVGTYIPVPWILWLES